eukprot:5019616-Pleurochrysis_carterae.AAC.5
MAGGLALASGQETDDAVHASIACTRVDLACREYIWPSALYVPFSFGNTSREFIEAVHNLTENDLFIWVAKLGHEHIPWTWLSEHQVHTVYFSVDPRDSESPCEVVGNNNIKEVWDYSLYNIKTCRDHRLKYNRNNLPVFRYLPPGAIESSAVADHQQPAHLAFMGHVKFGSRLKCWGFLKSRLGPHLVNLNGVWTPSAFEALVKGNGIHLNLHKRCDPIEPRPLETFRLSTLLSAQALIISERADVADEEPYAGLVTFATVRGIQEEFDVLANMSKWARRELSRARAANFQRRFAPGRLLQNAGIGQLLAKLARHR